MQTPADFSLPASACYCQAGEVVCRVRLTGIHLLISHCHHNSGFSLVRLEAGFWQRHKHSTLSCMNLNFFPFPVPYKPKYQTNKEVEEGKTRKVIVL